MSDKIQIQPNIVKSGVIDLWLDIAINGHMLINTEESGLAIDPLALLRTIKEEGEVFIITCRCGNPGCAEITKGINVSRDEKYYYWEIGNISKVNISGNYFFDNIDYQKIIINGIEKFVSLWKTNENAQITPSLLTGNRNQLLKLLKESEPN